ncbi:MAG: RNA-binding S4 domain-containing protein [Planctomycetaceae bacterium]|nr:RNA-binding S4 domain-containing protein [Planctomycetaceae bacterium]
MPESVDNSETPLPPPDPETGGSGADAENAPPASEETIKLDQFLKLANLVSTGGEAKMLIQGGEVFVNNEVETRRGRKLRNGDTVTYLGEDYVIEAT